VQRIFGPMRDEVTGEWRKLDNEELHTLYSSPRIIRMVKSKRTRWTEHSARMAYKKNAYRTWVRKPEEKRPLGRRKTWGFRMDWINLAQDRD
jgi:hypothetical protein